MARLMSSPAQRSDSQHRALGFYPKPLQQDWTGINTALQSSDCQGKRVQLCESEYKCSWSTSLEEKAVEEDKNKIAEALSRVGSSRASWRLEDFTDVVKKPAGGVTLYQRWEHTTQTCQQLCTAAECCCHLVAKSEAYICFITEKLRSYGKSMQMQ